MSHLSTGVFYKPLRYFQPAAVARPVQCGGTLSEEFNTTKNAESKNKMDTIRLLAGYVFHVLLDNAFALLQGHVKR